MNKKHIIFVLMTVMCCFSLCGCSLIKKFIKPTEHYEPSKEDIVHIEEDSSTNTRLSEEIDSFDNDDDIEDIIDNDDDERDSEEEIEELKREIEKEKQNKEIEKLKKELEDLKKNQKNTSSSQSNNTSTTTKPSTTQSKKSSFSSRAATIEAHEQNVSDNSMNQAEFNTGIYEVYQEWDALLNEVYQYLKSTMSSSEFSKLKKDELNWINKKEAAVKAAAAEWKGGTGEPAARYGTAASYTKERCYYLISLVE